MNIAGFQKTTLLDYPDLISSIIWTVGCNFRCPFCYNKDLVLGLVEKIPEKNILNFLDKRKELIEGLVISGGEPLIQKDILSFCQKVKKFDYKIKIDTNGTKPNILQDLINKKLVDYISMDIKAPRDKYNNLTNAKINLKDIEKSVNIIKNDAPDYEFKTTIIPNLLKKKDIIEIAKWLKGSKKFYLQQFKQNVPLISAKLENFTPYSRNELIDILDKIKEYFKICDIRGL